MCVGPQRVRLVTSDALRCEPSWIRTFIPCGYTESVISGMKMGAIR